VSNSTITLQNVVNLAATHVDLVPLAGIGGYTNEPALSLCNDVIQTLFAPQLQTGTGRPIVLDWKWNRAEMGMFVTSPNRQDYKFAGAVLFTLSNVPQGVGIDLASASALTIVGSTVAIKTLDQYNGSVGDVCYIQGTGSNYDSTLTQNGITSTWGGNTYTITAINGLTVTATLTGSASGTSGSAGITDFGWLVAGTLVCLNTNTAIFPTRHLNAVRDLQPYSYASTPTEVAVIQDLGTGVLRIRFRPVPGAGMIWGCNLVYQKKAPLKTALTQTWTPIPDEVSYAYRQGFLARAYEYINSPKAEAERQKFEMSILKALGGDCRETSDISLYPAEGIGMSQDYGLWWP
jgi:hypothetical protein